MKGKILACLRGDTARVEKGRQAALAGAVGMILCNDKLSGNEITADAHVLPASQITYKDGVEVLAYINSSKYLFCFPMFMIFTYVLPSIRTLFQFCYVFYVMTGIQWDTLPHHQLI